MLEQCTVIARNVLSWINCRRQLMDSIYVLTDKFIDMCLYCVWKLLLIVMQLSFINKMNVFLSNSGSDRYNKKGINIKYNLLEHSMSIWFKLLITVLGVLKITKWPQRVKSQRRHRSFWLLDRKQSAGRVCTPAAKRVFWDGFTKRGQYLPFDCWSSLNVFYTCLETNVFR